MAADPLTPDVSQRICAHMNDDHSDAVLLYAKVYGKTEGATAATMESIDPTGMNLSVVVDGHPIAVRVPFERSLTDSEDAHQVLIAMVRQARTMA